MTFLIKTIAAAGLLAGGLATGAASAMPVARTIDTNPAGIAKVEIARLVCNYRRCYRTGYYRPVYRYYRPYYYRPHIGIGLGGFGIGFY